jgi:hypothetical protein
MSFVLGRTVAIVIDKCSAIRYSAAVGRASQTARSVNKLPVRQIQKAGLATMNVVDELLCNSSEAQLRFVLAMALVDTPDADVVKLFKRAADMRRYLKREAAARKVVCIR